MHQDTPSSEQRIEHRDVLVVGGALMDYLVKGPSLPRPGTTVQGTSFQKAPGGKGANQAIAAARLGAAVAFIGRIGIDRDGDEILLRLSAEHVDTRFVLRDPNQHTGVALVMVDEAGEKQILTAPGASRNLCVADIDAARERMIGAKVVLAQLEAPLDTVAAALRVARAAGARVLLDPAPPQPLTEDVLRTVHVLRPNATEAEVLSGVAVRDRMSARKAADNLMHRGAGAVCIGAPGGNLVVSSDAELWLPHLPVDVVDTTGAGDAFAGALATALAGGQDLANAAHFAHAAAALATTKLGAQASLPRRSEVLELLELLDRTRAVHV
jgi:ribokinase